MVLIECKFSQRCQIAPAVVTQHCLRPVRRPGHRPAQHARGLRAEEILRVGKGLHAKATTHIRNGHAHRFRVQLQRFGQLRLMRPDPLCAQRHMQARAVPFRKASARLHRVTDDPVVAYIQ